jgi:hypothetical protein
VREKAWQELIRLGERAREALRKAAASTDLELKARAASLLKSLDLSLELRPWYVPESRVTLSGEFTLQEAVAEIERASAQKVTVVAPPEGRFKLELRGVPFWEALEAAAKASGKRVLAVGKDGPRFIGERWVEPRSRIAGPFRVLAGSASTYRRFDVTSKRGETVLTVGLSVAWERSIHAMRAYLALSTVRDDSSNDLTEGFAKYAERIFPGYWPAFLQEKRVFVEGFAPTTAALPERAMSVDVQGTVTVYIRGAEGDLQLGIPAPGAPTRTALEVCDERLEKVSTVAIVLSDFKREGTTVNCELSFMKVDPRLVEDIYNHLYLSRGFRFPERPPEWTLPPVAARMPTP